MKSSEYLYSSYYDVDFVKQHIGLFHRQIIWAEDTIVELSKKPLTSLYFDFDTLAFTQFPVRDLVRINRCSEAIKWNRKKIAECYGKDIG